MKEKFIFKNSVKDVAWKLVLGPFLVLKNLLWKGIWRTPHNWINITYLISVTGFKNSIFQ